MTSPEEWSGTEGHVLAKHVKCSMRALITSIDPMFNSSLLTSHPVWERAYITSCIDILYRSLKEWITDNCSTFISLDSWFISRKIFSLRDHTTACDNHRYIMLGAIGKWDLADFSFIILGYLGDVSGHMKNNAILCVFISHHWANLISKNILKWIFLKSDNMNSKFILILAFDSSSSFWANKACSNDSNTIFDFCTLLFDRFLIIVISNIINIFSIDSLDPGWCSSISTSC